MQPKPYVPRTDLGFPDRRRASRFEVCFNDEAEVECWERGDRSDGLEAARTPAPLERPVRSGS